MMDIFAGAGGLPYKFFCKQNNLDFAHIKCEKLMIGILNTEIIKNIMVLKTV